MQESDDTLWCLVCNTFLRSRSAADRHFSSSYHSERIKYLVYMKRNASLHSSAADEKRAKRIHEIYQTPHDYIQAQHRMTTKSSGSVDERQDSATMWQRDEMQPAKNRNYKSRKHRKGKNNGELPKMTEKVDESLKKNDKIDHPPNETFEIDKQSVVSNSSGNSSRSPSVWGRQNHNINRGTSDYWGSSNIDNRFQGRSQSNDDDRSTWSIGTPQEARSVDYRNDDRESLTSTVRKRHGRQSVKKPEWLEYQHQKVQAWNSGGSSYNRYHSGFRGHKGGSRGFGPRNGVQSPWNSVEQVQRIQHVKQGQRIQQIKVQTVPQGQHSHQIQPSQPMQSALQTQTMQPAHQVMQANHQIQPVQQQMRPVQQQMQPVQQQMQPVQQQMQSVQQQMKPVHQQMQQTQSVPPMLTNASVPPLTPMQMLHQGLLSNEPVVVAPSIGQMFREAGARRSTDNCKKQTTTPCTQPSSPSKGQKQKEPENKPPPKDILRNTYFGNTRPVINVDDDVTAIYVRHPDIYDVPDEDLKKFFSVFGEVVSVKKPAHKQVRKMNPYKPPIAIVITFSDSSAVRAAVEKTLFLGGKFTNVNPVFNQGQPRPNPKLKKSKAPVDIYDLQALGRSGLSFDEALALFKEGIRSEIDDLALEAKQRALCRDLVATFRSVLPGVEAKLFGSSHIGLRLKDSDTDIFMDCPSGQPPRDFVYRYGKLMYNKSLFENVLKIPNARVPIITFNHVETGLLCDVTFLNKLGLKNSQMLKFVLSLDGRIRDLALIVKYWAKVHELSGVGNFSNYALTVMVVFYLQQLDEPLVPSVHQLQQLATMKETCESWECSFCNEPSRLPPITNRSTTKDLLLGFYDYWARFDYAKFVACPLLGKQISKDDFKVYKNLPDELNRYKQHASMVEAQLEANKQEGVDSKMSKKRNYRTSPRWYEKVHALNIEFPMCVQDSFDLSYNITRVIKSSLLSRFQWLCEYARDEVLTKMTDKVFLSLFLPPTVKPPESVSKEFARQKDVYMDQFFIPGKTVSDVDYKSVWFMVLRLSVVYVLTHIYCLEIDMDDSNESKAIVSSENMDLTDRVYRTLCMRIKGLSCVFGTRNNVRKRLVFGEGMDGFVKECVVSRAVCELQRDKMGGNGGKCDNQLGDFQVKLRFFCFPDEQRPRLMVQYINCKSSHFNLVMGGLKGLFCTSLQHNLTKMLRENSLGVGEYVRSAGGQWNDFGDFFENFVRHCNDSSKQLSADPKYKIVFKEFASNS